LNKEVFMNKKFKILATLLIVVGTFLTGCGKKGSNSNNGGGAVAPVTPGGLVNTCTVSGTCAGLLSPALLGTVNSSVASSGVQVDFAFDIMGDTSRFNFADPKALVLYNGPAVATGYMRIQAATASICGMLAGEYTMEASAQGVMQMGVLTNARVRSVAGPTGLIEGTIIKGVVYTPANSTGNRLYLTLVLDTVNGQPCGAVISGI
jgi:hypothetical protein